VKRISRGKSEESQKQGKEQDPSAEKGKNNRNMNYVQKQFSTLKQK
jgi:hypothetical protein